MYIYNCYILIFMSNSENVTDSKSMISSAIILRVTLYMNHNAQIHTFLVILNLIKMT